MLANIRAVHGRTTGAIRRALAQEFYLRVRRSTLIGCLGVLVMAFVEVGHTPIVAWLIWTLVFLAIMAVRVVRCTHAIRRLSSTGTVNTLFDEVLPSVTALMWGGALFVFDTGALDHLFFMRLVIVFAATAFVQASLSVYPRCAIGFVATIWLAMAAFSIRPYVEPIRLPLLLGLLVYFVMLVANAIHLGRLAVRAVVSQYRARRLSLRLTVLLEAEREMLARERQLTEALASANLTLDHLARHDNLTGLLNRTALYEHLEREQARAARYGGDFCVVMVDLDHFKRVNDDYGHLVGDHVLQAVASALSGQLRGNDVLGRYGGEEFVAMLPETTLPQAEVLIERLRACVAALRPDTAAGPIPVTISMGLAAYRQGDSLEQLLGRADDALYRAKAAGRNRYEVGV